MTISKRIKTARKMNKMTQEKLAELMGISRVTISSWENGENSPTAENVAALANALSVSADYLLLGVNESESEFPTRVASLGEDQIFLDTFNSLNRISRDEVIKFIRYKQYEEKESN